MDDHHHARTVKGQIFENVKEMVSEHAHETKRRLSDLGDHIRDACHDMRHKQQHALHDQPNGNGKHVEETAQVKR